MGNQSEKKNLKNWEKLINFYFFPTLIAAIIFLIQNMLNGFIFQFQGFIFCAFVILVSLFCYRSIDSSLKLGLKSDSYSLYLDVLVLNIVVQVGSLFSAYFLYLYYIFPLILLWKLLSLCWGWATNVEYVEEQGQKKKEKKKRF